jgi:hypothetical protein
MDSTTLFAEGKEGQEQTAKGMQSLYEVCHQVVDGRCARGKRVSRWQACWWCWCWRSWQACRACWRQVTGSPIRKRCYATGCSDRGNACHVPIRTVMRLPRLDSQQVNAALAAWCVRKEAESRCGQEPSRLAVQPSERHVHLAIDGKALRGTGKQAYGGEEPQKQVLHVYEAHTGIVLQQCPIAKEHNEVSTLKPVFTEVLCKGRILTADAAEAAIMSLGVWSSVWGVR